MLKIKTNLENLNAKLPILEQLIAMSDTLVAVEENDNILAFLISYNKNTNFLTLIPLLDVYPHKFNFAIKNDEKNKDKIHDLFVEHIKKVFNDYFKIKK